MFNRYHTCLFRNILSHVASLGAPRLWVEHLRKTQEWSPWNKGPVLAIQVLFMLVVLDNFSGIDYKCTQYISELIG